MSGSDCKCQQYIAYIGDLGNIGQRHENSRTYYMSIISGLFVVLSLAGKDGLLSVVQGPVLYAVGALAVLLCVVWILHMNSFGAIYHAKFHVLRQLEAQLELQNAFDEEYRVLKTLRRYRFLTILDSFAPALIGVLFVSLIAIKAWISA